VFNYVAIIIISELDEIYYTQVNSKLKEEFEDRVMEIPIRNTQKVDITFGMHWVDYIMLKTVDGLYLLYDLLYFHFTPYLIFIILANWKRLRDVEPTVAA